MNSLLIHVCDRLVIRSDFIDAAEGNQTVSMRDLDYDDDATTRQVRIVAIEEAVAKPADAGRWGESAVRLTLVEV